LYLHHSYYEREFIIKKSAHLLESQNELSGCVQGHRDGHGFVSRDDGGADVYLAPNEMRAVLHKDRVKVRILKLDRQGRPEGRITEIIERLNVPIIGRLLKENGLYLVAPEDKRYGQDILIHKKGLGDAEVGKVVVVELMGSASLFGQPMGCVREVLGDIDDPGMEIEIAVRKYSVPYKFSHACTALSKLLPTEVCDADRLHRIDLTDVALVTIDGEDARDFDDAVYCEPISSTSKKTKNTEIRWRLIVAIADVSHYVENGSEIDIDAYDRATSIYFPRRVIPMLPEKLSNGLCSLNPKVERLCMACDMVISSHGEIEAYQFYPARILSQARFTYTEVSAILANTKGPEAAQRTKMVPHLLNLHGVYQALLGARKRRGAMDFDTIETQILYNESGRIDKIVPRTRTEAHRLIEEAMLAANVCSAGFVNANKHLCLFRVHEGPTPEKRKLLNDYLRALGIAVNLPDSLTSNDFQRLAEITKERPDAPQIHTMLLRSMQQAIYSPDNSGHFGLAYDAYTHFTSPIRRYPDLLVHRVIKAILVNQKYQLPKLPMPGEAQANLARRLEKAKMSLAKQNHDAEKSPKRNTAEHQSWQAAGLHCSANERRADEASRDVEAWLKCKYMNDRLGEEYSGTVSAVTSFGIFITIDAMYVEGLIHISELGSDYFQFDEVRQELRGERSGIRYRVGSKTMVQVSRVDLDARRIDFRLLKESDAEVVGMSSKSTTSATTKIGTRKSEETREAKTSTHTNRRAVQENKSVKGGKKDIKATASIKKTKTKGVRSQKK
jgi:ribonuclease R